MVGTKHPHPTHTPRQTVKRSSYVFQDPLWLLVFVYQKDPYCLEYYNFFSENCHYPERPEPLKHCVSNARLEKKKWNCTIDRN